MEEKRNKIISNVDLQKAVSFMYLSVYYLFMHHIMEGSS